MQARTCQGQPSSKPGRRGRRRGFHVLTEPLLRRSDLTLTTPVVVPYTSLLRVEEIFLNKLWLTSGYISKGRFGFCFLTLSKKPFKSKVLKNNKVNTKIPLRAAQPAHCTDLKYNIYLKKDLCHMKMHTFPNLSYLYI